MNYGDWTELGRALAVVAAGDALAVTVADGVLTVTVPGRAQPFVTVQRNGEVHVFVDAPPQQADDMVTTQ